MGETNVCINCGNNFTGKYCNNCGEKRYTEKDKHVKHLFSEAFHFITHFEGTFFNTLKAIFTKPGKLSADYSLGIRKKYFKPLSFFLLLVILYLLFPVFEGLNMKLRFHETRDFYGSYATQKVNSLLQARGISHEELAALFHRKGEKISKFLLFTTIPFLGLVSWLLAYKKRKLYFDNTIFSIEIGSFFILWGFLLLPLIIILYHAITGNYFFTTESQTGLAVMVVMMLFTYLAARRFFSFSWWYGIIYSLLLCISLVIFIEYIYKFILFFIAIHLV